MNDIKQLLAQKENRKLEFKQTLPNHDKIIKTAIAFSNCKGGYLIIGVADNNQILGINDDDIINFEENISNIIYDNCSPTIIP